MPIVDVIQVKLFYDGEQKYSQDHPCVEKYESAVVSKLISDSLRAGLTLLCASYGSIQSVQLKEDSVISRYFAYFNRVSIFYFVSTFLTPTLFLHLALKWSVNTLYYFWSIKLAKHTSALPLWNWKCRDLSLNFEKSHSHFEQISIKFDPHSSSLMTLILPVIE